MAELQRDMAEMANNDSYTNALSMQDLIMTFRIPALVLDLIQSQNHEKSTDYSLVECPPLFTLLRATVRGLEGLAPPPPGIKG